MGICAPMLVKETVPRVAGHMTDVLFRWEKKPRLPKTNKPNIQAYICDIW